MDASLVRPGMTVGRYLWGIVGPTVAVVGVPVAVCDGWFVPVQYRNGTFALLREYQGNGSFSIHRIVEWKSNNPSSVGGVKYSAKLPRIVEGEDQGILYVHTAAHDPLFGEVVYEHRLCGVRGHFGGKDEVVPCYNAALMDA